MSQRQAGGALLLFVTNVSAILAMGTVVLTLYGVPKRARADRRPRRRRTGVVTAVMVVLVAIPLAATSYRVTRTETGEAGVRDVATTWSEDAGWEVVQVTTQAGRVVVRVGGPLPEPDLGELRSALDAKGLDDVTVEVEMVPTTRAVLEGGG